MSGGFECGTEVGMSEEQLFQKLLPPTVLLALC